MEEEEGGGGGSAAEEKTEKKKKKRRFRRKKKSKAEKTGNKMALQKMASSGVTLGLGLISNSSTPPTGTPTQGNALPGIDF